MEIFHEHNTDVWSKEENKGVKKNQSLTLKVKLAIDFLIINQEFISHLCSEES